MSSLDCFINAEPVIILAYFQWYQNQNLIGNQHIGCQCITGDTFSLNDNKPMKNLPSAQYINDKAVLYSLKILLTIFLCTYSLNMVTLQNFSIYNIAKAYRYIYIYTYIKSY